MKIRLTGIKIVASILKKDTPRLCRAYSSRVALSLCGRKNEDSIIDIMIIYGSIVMQNIELIFIYAIAPISLSQSKLNAP